MPNNVEPALPWMKLTPPHEWRSAQVEEMRDGKAYDCGDFVASYERAKPRSFRAAERDTLTIQFGGDLHLYSKAALKAWGGI
jgi:hypothetical protein